MRARQFLYIYLIVTILLLNVTVLTAQSKGNTLQGKVVDEYGNPIPYTTVAILNSTIGTVTDDQGNFSLTTHRVGDTQIVIRSLGYEEVVQKVSFETSKTQQLKIQLKTSSTSINELTVSGKSEATILREQSYAVEVIEAKEFKNLSTNGFDILSKISGVNIRQSGGLGSTSTLSLNGLSDNQVRIFIDGMPMDYFGTSLSLNNFSANLIERIEVYKGVVPIHLSADALGGAINVVTNVNSESFVDASYSMGSFGTHIGSLNSRFRDKKSGFTIDLKSFYNHADNNYKVPIYLVDFETGKESKTPTYVEHFHDAYTSRMVWVETGFTGSSFADMLMFGAMYSDNYKEIQQPENAVGEAKIPYGEVVKAEDKVIFTGKFSKKEFLLPKLSIQANGVAIFANNLSRDTSSYRYDWFGNKEFFNANVGETENRKTLLNLKTENYLGSAFAEYEINDQHGIAANYSANYLVVQGTDEKKAQNQTQFKYPSKVKKNIAALSYSNKLLNKKLKNTVFTKLYDYNLKSVSTGYQGEDPQDVSIDKDFFGYGLASTYHFKHFQAKASFEFSTRFPEMVELFGDGMTIEANSELLPEQSYNYNVGGIYTYSKSHHVANVSLNLFFRDTENFIRYMSSGVIGNYINDPSVISKGIDISSTYTYKQTLQLQLNGSYIDKRNNDEYYNGKPNNIYKQRVPNEPYLFGRLFASYRFKQVLTEQDIVSISVSENYVHGFPYSWSTIGSQDKSEVPSQLSTDIEAVYSLKEGKYNLSFGVQNVFDAKIYDNFEQLRPGRTYTLKLRIFIQ